MKADDSCGVERAVELDGVILRGEAKLGSLDLVEIEVIGGANGVLLEFIVDLVLFAVDIERICIMVSLAMAGLAGEGRTLLESLATLVVLVRLVQQFLEFFDARKQLGPETLNVW